MKKHICEFGGCRKTAKVKLRNGHGICEDHAKLLRRIRRSGAKPKFMYKEVLVEHIGDASSKFDVCVDVPIKL